MWGLFSLQRELLCLAGEMGSPRGRGAVWPRVRGGARRGVSSQFLLPLPPPAWALAVKNFREPRSSKSPLC